MAHYEEFKKTLYSLGETPLPKFINRPVEPEDRKDTRQFLQSMKVLLLLQLQACILAANC